jgi:hypothetical protein
MYTIHTITTGFEICCEVIRQHDMSPLSDSKLQESEVQKRAHVVPIVCRQRRYSQANSDRSLKRNVSCETIASMLSDAIWSRYLPVMH